ncbi:MAG: hypothetical protein R3E39_17865 [Anaerolineae bacterium]
MVHGLWIRLIGTVICAGIGIVLAGCQGTAVSTQESVLIATPTFTASPLQTSIQTEVTDVRISMEVPAGWRSQQARYGVLLIEKSGYYHPDNKLSGIQMYVFVRAVDDFSIPASTNPNDAWNILDHIASVPGYIGDAAVSRPKGFKWHGIDGAYYMLTDSHHNLSLVVALILPQPKRLVAFNISCPQERAADIRAVLPDLLMGLTLNDMTIDSSLVEALPDPLEFPAYEYTYPEPTATS